MVFPSCVFLLALAAPLGAEPCIVLEALLGGAPPRPGPGGHSVAWFRCSAQGIRWEGEAGERRLRLARGAWIEAPLAVPPAELVPTGAPPVGVVLRRGGRGRLRLLVRDGRGELERIVPLAGGVDFSWQLSRRLAPRVVLRLEVLAGEVILERLSCRVPWPRVSPTALQVLLDGELAWLAAGLERACDRDGARATSFLTRIVDPATGAILGRRAAGHHPYYESLLNWQGLQPSEPLRRRLLRFTRDLVELGCDPRTGLARLYDGVLDRPLGELPVDPRGALEFLMRAERALDPPAELRAAIERGLRNARNTLLAGQRPGGAWSSRWIPTSGGPASDMPVVRALRTAALVVEIERHLGLERSSQAALAALLHLELRLHWPGSPALPDPGLDDYFGHLVRDALVLAAGEGAGGPFRVFIARALAHYRPLWSASQRGGGMNAPDQERAFELFLETASGRAERAASWRECLLSWRNLARSTQLPGGLFADVTAAGFEPRLHLPVGDLPAVPFHLLRLGAALHADAQGAPEQRAELRAVCASALLWLRLRRRGLCGFGRGARGFADTARLFSVLIEWRRALDVL